MGRETNRHATSGTGGKDKSNRSKKQRSRQGTTRGREREASRQDPHPHPAHNTSANQIPLPTGQHVQEFATAAKYKMDQPEAMEQAEKWAKRTLEKGVGGLVQDFTQLKQYVPPNHNTETYRANPDKNRYPDVWCEDSSRVKLRWPSTRTNDYIHANYVRTPNFSKRFICTQGPLSNTIADFWHMIIQEDCEFILMLCNIEENGIPKCAPYWPTEKGQKMSVERVDITNIKVEQPPPGTDEKSIRRTTLELKYNQGGKRQSRKVRHFHWIDWPDRGVPRTSLTAMVLLSCVRGSVRPIAIHCAAGIGRTGSITSIEYVIEHFTDGKSCEDMIEIVKGLRQQRLFSIQNHQQYLFIHRILLMYFIDKYQAVAQTSDLQRQYDQFKREYDQHPGMNQ